jgi:hypothetical protein
MVRSAALAPVQAMQSATAVPAASFRIFMAFLPDFFEIMTVA